MQLLLDLHSVLEREEAGLEETLAGLGGLFSAAAPHLRAYARYIDGHAHAMAEARPPCVCV